MLLTMRSDEISLLQLLMRFATILLVAVVIMICAFGSEAWMRSMGYKIVDEWRPWTSNEQVAGYFRARHALAFTVM